MIYILLTTINLILSLSIADDNIDFQTMTCCSSSLRRLCTPSSVTKPTFVLTTQWLWYWKNDKGQWIEYGEQVTPHPVQGITSEEMCGASFPSFLLLSRIN